MANAVPVHHSTLKPEEKPAGDTPEVVQEKPAVSAKPRKLKSGEAPEKGVPYLLENGSVRVDH